MTTATDRPIYRSRWWMPSVCLVIGLLMLGAFAIGGDVEGGLISFAIMAGLGALFLLGTRSETLQGIGGPARDARWATIDLHATALTGMVLVLVIIGGFLVEIARGEDGSPWSQLGAVGGLVYVAAVVLLRRRT